MNKKSFCMVGLLLTVICTAQIVFSFSAEVIGQGLEPLLLPEPQTEIGRPLMQVLKDRKSSREFSADELPLQVLSNILWAAFGVNRQESGKRTAPSAVNWQEIDIYVAIAEGLFLYDAGEHVLNPVLAEDIRGKTGTQSFVKDAPVNLIYVVDYYRMTGEKKIFYSAADTGFISLNIYLYCASEGLATVVRGLVNRPALARVMRLRPSQRVTLCQSVGYPNETRTESK